MSVKSVVFDFDGTLADTFETIITAINLLAPTYGFKSLSSQEVEHLRGTDLHLNLLKNYNISKLQLPFIVLKIQSYLKNNLELIKPIVGVTEVILACKEQNWQLGVLTSNSGKTVANFLENNQIAGLFDFIYSSRNIFAKHHLMSRMLKEQGLQAREVVYVGDESRDVKAARKVNMNVIAVSWGFTKREALVASEPDALVDQPAELLNAILSI